MDIVESDKGEKKTTKFNQYLSTIIADLIVFCFGLSIGWVSPNILLLRSKDTPFPAPLTTEEMSWVGSIHLLAAMVGVLISGYCINNLGRKIATCFVALPIMVCWIFIIFGNDVIYVIVARIFMGLGAGGVYTAISLYIAEISEDSIRGRLGSSLTMSNYFGCLVSYVICPHLSYGVTPYVLIAPMILAFVVAVIMLPETPVFLIKQGKIEEANTNLRWLRGIKKNDNTSNEIVDLELQKIKASLYSEKPKVSYRDFVTQVALRGFFIGIAVLLIQQLSTVFALMSFAATVFQESGSSINPNDATVIIGCLLFAGAVSSTFLVERAGRRILLIFSCLAVSASLLTLGTFSYIKTIQIDVSAFGWIPVAALSVCLFSFSVGLGPLGPVVVAEIFSPQIRGFATSICVFIFWLLAFLLVKSFNGIIAQLGMYGCFWLFGSSLIFGAVFIYVFLPETKGRDVEHILAELSRLKKKPTEDIKI